MASQGQPIVGSKNHDSVLAEPVAFEHNEQVSKEILGLSDEEIADLMVEQVLY